MIGIQSSDGRLKNLETVNRILFIGKTMMRRLSCLVLFGLLSVGCSPNDSDETDDFGNYGDGTTPVRPDDIILFEDTVPHDICVNLWDTNGDGQLSYREAAAVKSIGLNFRGNEQMRHFTELRYFTGLTSIQDEAFYECEDLRSIEIPKNVTSIGERAFYDCSNLTSSITIPSGVTSIGEYAFFDCSNLTGSITIPNSVTSIGDWTFYWCSSLTSITIPSGITSIGESAFRGCSSLTSITIPNSVTSIGESAFSYCRSLTSITIPNGITSIGDSAFNCCSSLTSITIPASVETIEAAAFYGCSELATVTFEKGSKLKTIGGRDSSYYGAFSDCTSLTSIEIPASVETIKAAAFQGCSNLTTITFEKGSQLKTIGGSYYYYYGAFASLSSLQTVDMSACTQVELIEQGAFYGASNLRLFKIGTATPPKCGYSAFWNLPTYSVLKVPSGSVDAYKAADEWRKFTSITGLDE